MHTMSLSPNPSDDRVARRASISDALTAGEKRSVSTPSGVTTTFLNGTPRNLTATSAQSFVAAKHNSVCELTTRPHASRIRKFSTLARLHHDDGRRARGKTDAVVWLPVNSL